jgi:predicted DNA-binding transcriptional regulator AlpA
MGELATELKGLLQEMVEKTALTLVPSKLMTAQQVAALLEVSDDTFAKIRVSAGFPAPVMIGQGDRCRRWKKADIDNWIDNGGYQQKPKTGRKRNAA